MSPGVITLQVSNFHILEIQKASVSSSGRSCLFKTQTLQIEPNAMTEGYGNVKQGDCVVAFSRKAIYEVKASIERHTGLK